MMNVTLEANILLYCSYFLSADAVAVLAWDRGQGVSVDHAAIVEILIQQLDDSRRHPISAATFCMEFLMLSLR